MKKLGFYGLIPLFSFCLVFGGCSGGKETEQAKGSEKPATEQTKDAIRDYGKNALDKARAAQQMGDERLKAIEEATRKK